MVVIEPKYIKVSNFYDGMAWFKDEYNKIGFINKEGEVVIKPKYEVVKDFQMGLARVREGDKFGCINKKGEWVIQPKFFRIKKFDKTSGMAMAKDEDGWGYIKNDGEMIRFKNVNTYTDYSEGFSRVRIGKQWQYIDVNGGKLEGVIVDNKLKKMDASDVALHLVGFGSREFKGSLEPFQNGLARVKYNSKWGVVNTKGEWIIKPQYRYLKEFFIVN
ncbi:MAG: WG repeat-containing protein [Flavobacteriales bacterium]|nr:WG repeat-containing protein [Flavobacteriales bacterium]